MHAGKLRHRLYAQERNDATDSYGEPVTTWIDRGGLWASVVPLTGDELVNARRIQAETTHRIETRWGCGVTTRHRLRYPDSNGTERFFEILAAMNFQERNRELHLLCKELT